MDKPSLQKCIAEVAYNVGFGAKRSFASFEIITQFPSIIGFISTAVGVLALVFDIFGTKGLSACMIILGILGWNISLLEPKARLYEKAGVKLTDLFNRLRNLYLQVTSTSDSADLKPFEDDLKSIEAEYIEAAITDQVFFSSWYAHYKFFWEHQIGWVDEQLKFKLFRDRIPLSFSIFVAVASLIILVLIWNSVMCTGSASTVPVVPKP